MAKVIHRAWFGPEPLPDRYAAFGETWAKLNPDWEVRMWTLEEVEPLLDPPIRRIWNHIRKHGAISAIPHKPEVAIATQLADLAGYTIVYTQGGVYLNCDMEPLRPLSDLPVQPEDAWACIESGHWINNGALGGPPEHPFWRAVLDELPHRFKRLDGMAMNHTTGPRLLTDVAASTPGLVVLPQKYFNLALLSRVPLGGNANRYRKRAISAGAVALHHWHHRTAAARTDV